MVYKPGSLSEESLVVCQENYGWWVEEVWLEIDLQGRR